MAEVNDLLQGWDEYPPTNLIVKAFVGWKTPPKEVEDPFNVPPAAQAAMQNSVVTAIATKADPSWLPVWRGTNPALPKTAPIFDPDELRNRNRDVLRKRVVEAKKRV